MDPQAAVVGAIQPGLRDSTHAVNKQEAAPLTSSTTDETLASSSQQQPSSTSPPVSASITQNKEIDTAKRIKMADKSNLAGVVIGMLVMVPAILAGLLMSGTPWYLIVGPVCVPVLMVAYYYMPKTRTKAKRARLAKGKGGPDIKSLPAVYFCYVLGSGGHTTEMMELVRKSLRPSKNIHRRYIFTTGDRNSLVAMTNFEQRISEVYGPNAGTWDAYQVTRARKVHQPLWTTWLTSILSALSAYEALTTPPDLEIRPRAEDQRRFKYPHVITTNGPGTGIIVALIAHLLKIFWVRNCMKVVFIETWAHVRTLSLTGKLFHWMRLPNVYLVQHQPLAERYGYPLFEFITAPRPVPRPVPNADRPWASPPSPAMTSSSGLLLVPAASGLQYPSSASSSVSPHATSAPSLASTSAPAQTQTPTASRGSSQD